jgi:hypothetical protein
MVMDPDLGSDHRLLHQNQNHANHRNDRGVNGTGIFYPLPVRLAGVPFRT